MPFKESSSSTVANIKPFFTNSGRKVLVALTVCECKSCKSTMSPWEVFQITLFATSEGTLLPVSMEESDQWIKGQPTSHATNLSECVLTQCCLEPKRLLHSLFHCTWWDNRRSSFLPCAIYCRTSIELIVLVDNLRQKQTLIVQAKWNQEGGRQFFYIISFHKKNMG